MDSVAHAALVPAPRAPSDMPRFLVRKAKVRDGGENVYGVPVFTYPPASAIAEDVLEWLERQNGSVVLDPDSRTWLRYDCATGRYSPVQGTAEQAARVLIREAAATCANYGGNGWRAKVSTLTGEEPLHFGLIPVSGHQATLSEIASAMVDLASGGERAAQTRRGLADGRAPGVMYVPMTWRTWEDGGGYWSGLGSTDIDWSPGGPDTDSAVPLKAARYNPEDGMTVNHLTGDYNPLPHPGFDKLCALVWPDPAVREAALRSASMMFTGRATKYVPYWRAETDRGKSIMAALLKDLLGDYGRNVPAKLLFGYAADSQRAAEELAGAWGVVCEEGIGSQSFKADEAFKAVTAGGADLNARQLYRESREVRATHTILLTVNAEADMNYADPAIRSRLCPIRFDGDSAAIIDWAARYNPSTEAWKREAPAVLATLLDYARDFWSGKWKPVTLADIDANAELAEIIDESTTFAIEMKTGNNVAAYIAANRRQLAGAAEGHGARDLYRAYAQWAALVGQDTVSETAFGRALVKCDEVTRTREAKGTVYRIAPPAGQ